MADNPQGSSIEESVAALKANREERQAAQPASEEITGGTEEAQEVLESQPEEEEAQAAESETGGEIEHEEAGEEVETPTNYTVKIGGAEEEVTLDELKSGYQRDSDYRQKTMALSEQRKEVEAQSAAIADRVQKLESLIGQEEDSVDWESLRENDPTEFIRLDDIRNERKRVLDNEKAKLAEQHQKQHKAKVDVESAKLVEVMGPTWTDEKQKETFQEAGEYLATVGITVEQANQIVDCNIWQIIFHAKEYHKLKGTTAKIAKEIKSAPRSVKPGHTRQSSKSTEVDAAEARLKGSNKINELDNAVAFMKAKRERGKPK